MFDQALRKAKDKLLTRVSHHVSSSFPSLMPLQLTFIGFGIGLGACLCAQQGWYSAALILWLINRLFDGLDGTQARLQDQKSDLGGYVDMLCDLVIYTLLPLALATSVAGVATYLALGVLLSSFYINLGAWLYLSALLAKHAPLTQQTSIVMPTGLIEGAETIAFYSLFLLFPGQLILLFWFMAALVFVSALQRVWWAWQHL